MNTAYYDTSYLIKLQCSEAGSREVRAHAAGLKSVHCSWHGRAEFVSACHRGVREGRPTSGQLEALVAQLAADSLAGALVWLPLELPHIEHVEHVISHAPPSVFLRAADALHLACAAANGFSEIHSNDRHMLSAAPLFGLNGVNVIS